MKFSSSLFCLFISFVSFQFCTPDPGADMDSQINIRINNELVKVEALFTDSSMIPVYFCRYPDAENENQIEIRYSDEIANCRISPVRHGIEYTKIDPRQIRFSSRGKKDLVVYLNDTVKVFLFPLTQKRASMREVDITLMGVVSDPELIQTREIQLAIDSLATTGETIALHFPEGSFRTGTLYMRSNVYLSLDKDALVLGSMDTLDYPVEQMDINPDFHRSTRPNTLGSLIYFENIEKSGVFGPGMINANGCRWRRDMLPNYKWLNIFRIINCQDLHFDDFYLLDAIGWNTHIIRSDSIFFKNVKIINEIPPMGWNPHVPQGFWNNTDGINPDASTHVYIDSVFAHCGDDCITLKITNTQPGEQGNTEHIYVNNSLFMSSTGVLKCGTETLGDHIRNVKFSHIDVMDMKTGFPLKLTPRDRSAIHDIVFENIWFEQSEGGFLECKIMTPRYPEQPFHPVVKEIELNNLHFEHDSIKAVFISLSDEYNVRNVQFNNIFIKGEKVDSIDYLIRKDEFSSP